jgi:pRiA4b ORF-3-like protein
VIATALFAKSAGPPARSVPVPRFLFQGETNRMAETQTHVFRASLRAKVYRDFEMLSSETLHDLAATIVRLFDFDFDHAFGFYSKLTGRIFDSPVKYELFADTGESEARSVRRTRIADAFPKVGAKMTFLFDYGDGWQFRIEVIGLNPKEAGAEYPRRIKAVGKAPAQYPDYDDDE